MTSSLGVRDPDAGQFVAAGQIDEARSMLKAGCAVDPGWGELLRRLPAAGLWSAEEDVIDQLLG